MNSARPFADEPVELTAKFIIDPVSIETEVAQFLKKEPTVRQGQVVLLVIGIFLGFAVAMIGGPTALALAAVLFTNCAWIALTQPRLQARGFVKALKERSGARGNPEQCIEVTASTLTTSTSEARSTYKLSAIQRIECTERLAIVRTGPMQYLLIPATADFGRETFDSFVEKLKALHSVAREVEPS